MHPTNSQKALTKKLTENKLTEKLLTGAEQLGVAVSATQQAQLLHYLAALSLWNKKFNLTAITHPDDMLTKHVLDSMSMLPHLPVASQGNSLLDVGTGAGLPGVILAIFEPEWHCTVLDSNSKKIRFIRQVVGELALENVTPVHERIENMAQAAKRYDVITSRAFASLQDFVNLTQPVLAEHGMLAAMKGVLPKDEIEQLAANWQIQTQRLHVPFLADERHLVMLQRAEAKA